jgi:low affinity Fe/Cu permease
MEFDRISTACARLIGRPGMLVVSSLLAALAIVAFVLGDDRLMWGASLAISVVTVLLLPILQATQNRDGAALHAKLDELIKSDAAARNVLIGLEKRTQEEIEELRAEEEQTAAGE